ncbi:MAG: DUF58 domain-containing protein [Acidimicrobiales bacterium]
MRATRAGVGLLVVSAICLVSGRVFGLVELYVLATMGLAATALAALATLSVRLNLDVGRVASPTRLRVGSPARVDLSITNRSRRRTPVISAHDEVGGSRGATLLLAPIAARATARIAYRLPAPHRGELAVGPLNLVVGDPLGLTQRRSQAASTTVLLVHATLLDLAPLVATAGQDPTAERQQHRALAISGDEFFAHRPYTIGDPLKQVDWKASARADDLIIRQEERPRAGRVTVILDRRREVYDPDGFERAVSAALSALWAGWRGGDSLTFMTSANPAVTEIRSRADFDGVDEQLAVTNWTESASLVATLEERTKVTRGGTLVVITGRLAPRVDTALSRAGRAFGQVIAVSTDPVKPTPSWVLRHDGHADLAAQWHQVVPRTHTPLSSTASAMAMGVS